MAAPAFGSAGAGAASTTATLDVPYPAGISAGDLLVLHILHQSAFAVVTDPTDWTVLRKRDQADGENNGIYAYWKIASGSESGNLSVTNDSGDEGWFGRMYRFTGNNQTSPIEGSSTTSVYSTTTAEDADVITAGVDRLAVQLVAHDDVDTVASFTGELGGDWTEATAEYTDNSGIGLGDGRTGVTLQLQTATIATAGGIGGGTFTGAVSGDWVVFGFAITPAGPVSQFLAPSADSVDGAWTDSTAGTALAAAIDETPPSDSDYIMSEEAPVASGCRVKLASGTDPAQSTGHVIHWRARKDTAGSTQLDVTVRLRQGGGNSLGGGTLIAERTHTDISGSSWTTYDETLTGTEADTISDYSDLYLEFFADVP